MIQIKEQIQIVQVQKCGPPIGRNLKILKFSCEYEVFSRISASYLNSRRIIGGFIV